MDVLSFAIKMELDGEAFYREQANANEGNGLKTVFLMLAKDEQSHAALLEKGAHHSYALTESNLMDEARNVFQDLGAQKSAIQLSSGQLDVYVMAKEKERQSVALYEGMLADAADDQERKLFTYLIDQEKHHFAVMDELVLLLRHAADWVESAEFGLREEY